MSAAPTIEKLCRGRRLRRPVVRVTMVRQRRDQGPALQWEFGVAYGSRGETGPSTRCARSGRRVLCFSLSFSAELVGRGLAPAVQDTVGIRIGLRRIRTGYRSGGTKAPPYNGNSVLRMEVGREAQEPPLQGVWNSGIVNCPLSIVNCSPGGSSAARRWHRRRCPGWPGGAPCWRRRGRGSGPCGGGCRPGGADLLC